MAAMASKAELDGSRTLENQTRDRVPGIIMVVLQHDAVHQTLWGPAITTGRSKALDILVYRQIVVLTALAALCCLHYDKPTAVRLGVSGGVMLLYFRNTFLVS